MIGVKVFKRIFTILLSAILAAGSLVALAAPATASVGPMTIRYVTTAANQTVCLPIGGTNTGVKVDWKDGSALDSTILSSGTSAHMTHAFATAGIYDVEIAEGTITRFGSEYCATGTKGKMVAVLSWGNQIDNITSLERAFNEETEFIDVPNVMPPKVTTLAFTFARAYKFNDADISAWNIGGSIVGGIDSYGVTSLLYTFHRATAFNRPLNGWNTSKVINMSQTFSGGYTQVTPFNQSLDNWDTANVTNMSYMFSYSSFNQPIGSWNVSRVGNFSNMFSENIRFNQDLENWDTSAATDFSYMFYSATAFNGKVTNWKTNRATSMWSMFAYARNFDQPVQHISGTDIWKTSAVTNMSSVFLGAVKFNRDVSSWDTSAATTMESMFQTASAFNQDLSMWNTSRVTNMYGMFSSADSFDQSLASWDITKLAANAGGIGSANHMLTSQAGKGMSPANYSATLRGWAATLEAYKLAGNTPAAVALGAGSRKYFCDAATLAARDKLFTVGTTPYFGWTFGSADSPALCSGQQTVTWAPTNTTVDEGTATIVPNKKAFSDGHGAISYQVDSSTGTMVCSVANSGTITFTGVGSCVVRATAAAVEDIPNIDLTTGFRQVTFTARATQVITWTPSNLTALTTDATLTPDVLAGSNDVAGTISYSVQNAGTTGCTVNSTTGVIAFNAAGTCTIRASAQSTANSAAGFTDVSFVISAPPASSGGGAGGNVVEVKASPKVTEVSKKRVVGTRPTAIELVGQDLKKVSQIRVGSKTLPVVIADDEKLNFVLPTLASGTYQVELVHEDSLIAVAQSITVVAPTIAVSNFAGNSAKLTSQKIKTISNAVSLYSGAGSLTCIGSTSGAKATRFDVVLARQRAFAACNLAKKINPSLVTSIKVTPALGTSAKNRKVEMQFSK